METNAEDKALGRFKMGYVQDGLGKDGLPLYRETLLIVISRPPTLLLERAVEETDYDLYDEEYKQFQKQNAAKKHEDGYPLALWPVASAADVETCAARDIVTVQQLAEVRGEKMPPAIRELAERARKMIKLQQDVGKFEEKINDLEQQRDALQAELTECRSALAAQQAMIAMLQSKAA